MICSFHRHKKIWNDSSQHKLYNIFEIFVTKWLSHEIVNVWMSIVFFTSLDILLSLYQSRKKWRQNKNIWNNANESIFVYENRIYYKKRWKKIWTWIKNNRLWQKFHKNFAKFEKNYLDLIFIIQQIRDIKRMTKKIMSHIAIIWKSDFRVFKTLDLHTLKSIKKCTRVDYTMIEILQLFKKIMIYRLHYSKKKNSKKFCQQRRIDLA